MGGRPHANCATGDHHDRRECAPGAAGTPVNRNDRHQEAYGVAWGDTQWRIHADRRQRLADMEPNGVGDERCEGSAWRSWAVELTGCVVGLDTDLGKDFLAGPVVGNHNVERERLLRVAGR